MNKERSGVHGVLQGASEAVDDGGWTPVTRKTSRSHRERSNSSGRNEHTYTHNNIVSTPNASDTNHEFRHDELLCAIKRLASPSFVPRWGANLDALCPENTDSEEESVISPVPAPKLRKATVEEINDVEDLIILSEDDSVVSIPRAGPFQPKGKGVDPGNWGDTSSFQDYAEGDLKAQQEILLNYEEINRFLKEEEKSDPFHFL
ncbi:hypothetical protein B0H13DRAFT_2336543 [Mycena leptocephala]|nr:hypothetical protein B0H13DRAFT_2336543 [Mycena leptocephala]